MKLVLLLALCPLLGAQQTGTGTHTASPGVCPSPTLQSALTCRQFDHCQADAQCPRGLLCCPDTCGRRCRCPAAVCSQGCGAGQRCLWRRGAAVCQRMPPLPQCTPACGGDQQCKWARVGASVTAVCRRIDYDDLYESDERDDCFHDEVDDLFDDLFDDDDDDDDDDRAFRVLAAQGAVRAAARPALLPAVSDPIPQVRTAENNQFRHGRAGIESQAPRQVRKIVPSAQRHAQVVPEAAPVHSGGAPLRAHRPFFFGYYGRPEYRYVDDDRYDPYDLYDDDRYDPYDRFDDDRYDDDRFELADD